MILGCDQAQDIAPLDDAQIGQRHGAGANLRFQAWAADQQALQTTVTRHMVATGGEPTEIPAHVHCEATLTDHLISQAGEELLEDLAAAGVEAVSVPALRDAFARLAGLGERVSLQD